MSGQRLRVAHLTASPFYGGPERQMLGLAGATAPHLHNTFLCLMEGGKARAFLAQLHSHRFDSVELRTNHPHLIATVRETAAALRKLGADVLLTHGYKADIIGYPAARLARIPIIMVSRGWTGASRKVRFYEIIDRMALRRADHVVCVSEGQAAKVRAARVPNERITVLRNAMDVSRFSALDPAAGRTLYGMFPEPIKQVVVAVGRLSPEKGFNHLVEAATKVLACRDDVGFALIGDGPKRDELLRQIRAAGLVKRVILCGFRADVDRLLPHATMLVQSSHTEGMPNVVLEAMAAALPVVATEVGGTPELVVHGETGYLVPPANANALSAAMLALLGDSLERARLGTAARDRVETHFTFEAQARGYEQLLQQITSKGEAEIPRPDAVAARIPS